MLRLGFRFPAGEPLRLLALGAHADDIELGAGGTILRLLRENTATDVTWVVLSATRERAAEAGHSATAFLAGSRSSRIAIHEFPDGHFPYVGGQIKHVFEALKDVRPHLILTHRREDLHQDHRLVADLTWQTYRDHLILEYEIVKLEGDLGSPNLFVPLDDADCERKVELLEAGFPSQHGRTWFGRDVFRGLLRLRGVESNAPSGFAEGFTCRRVVM